MYDPTIGRWISEDPLGFEAGDSNLYRYAQNRPSASTDPSGMELVAPNRESAGAMPRLINDVLGEEVVQYFQAVNGRYVLVYRPSDEQKIKNLIANTDDPLLKRAMEALISSGNNTVNLEVSWSRIRQQNICFSALVLNGTSLTASEKAIVNAFSQRAFYGSVSNVGLFQAQGRVNGIADSVIGAILAAADAADPWLQWDMCLAWVNEFAKGIASRRGAPDSWPLRGSGLEGRIVTWDLDGSLANSHAAFKITFPNGQVFYFDNGWLSGNRITLPGQLPATIANER